MKKLFPLPLQLVTMILFVFLFGASLPLEVAKTFYTLSLFLKDSLLLFLPIAVASYISSTLIHFRKQAVLLVALILIFEAFSNASSVLYAYGVGTLFENYIPVFNNHHQPFIELSPFFSLASIRPPFWSADKGVIAGMVIGLIVAFISAPQLHQMFFNLRDKVGFVFSKIFAPLIPVYVGGFLFSLQYSGLLGQIIETYTNVIIIISLSIVLYLAMLFIWASKGDYKKLVQIIKNVWPTGVIAFTSMSSAATMPFTIEAAEKNLKNPKFAGMLIPATTNIQQIGDCIANALLCLVILKNFGFSLPDLSVWIPFMIVFVLARYTTAAVLGGAIFIMVPIYEKYLGFSPEMVALIIALNVVLDPIVTSSNVLANSALAIVFERIWLRISGKKLKESII